MSKIEAGYTESQSQYGKTVGHFAVLTHCCCSTHTSTKFEWTEELGACFEESKRKIIEDGVRSFDPLLVTWLSPDWCQDGMGWILQQKTCAWFTLPAESRYSPTEGECLAGSGAVKILYTGVS